MTSNRFAAVQTRVRRVISETLKVNPALVIPQANIEEDLPGDSMTLVELMLALEQEFEVSLEDSEWPRPSKVGAITELIIRKSSSRSDRNPHGRRRRATL